MFSKVKQAQSSKVAGFTLIELLVTVSIAAIVIGFATPAMELMIDNNRAASQTNILVASLGLARSEAIKTGNDVIVHRKGATASNWDAGWDIFFDINGDGDYDAGTDTLIKTYPALTGGFTLRTGASFDDSITFQASGLITPAIGDTFNLCNSDRNVDTARQIIINNVGRVYTVTGGAVC